MSKEESEDRRLWIGNLDPRITEYHLLKLVQKYGKIEKFDLLFHRNGPLVGQPRGYAFVTYLTKEEAVKAKEELNDVLLGTKNIRVTWAHSMSNEELESKPKVDVKIPALAMSKGDKKSDTLSQIQAIEAKLKLMEKKAEDELKINDTVATKPPVIAKFQQNQQTTSTMLNTSSTSNFRSKQYYNKKDRHRKPYSRNKTYR